MTDASTAISRRTLVWEDRTAWPMFVLSIAFFTAWMWLVSDATLAPAWQAALVATVVVTWVVFIGDFAVRLVFSGHPATFLRERWFELVSLVVPYLRPFVILTFIWRVPWFGTTSSRQRIRVIISVSLFTFLFVFAASSLVWLVERNAPDANIVNLGDAIWWGFTTIATVGYGDYVPVTVAGRVIAVGLMMGGLVVLGATSATVISALTEQMQRAGERRAREGELAHQAALAAESAEHPRRRPRWHAPGAGAHGPVQGRDATATTADGDTATDT
ncbi:potassium channel family protein [Microbacterium sp. Sa4CUA7]|uniref:Potassium channel family protein n=1 Tax=Microbacterium pullorum TaxID=2762236 RepID=A0ABR8S1Z7_9MICO|nr:potassium channel family protein [Microbacterium pullorum]MBD7957511.1 potassium channel family protein [Microbacterium pullorum]